LIQKLQKETPIPTCTPDKVLNATRAAIHLQTAKSFIDCKDYQGALDAYGSALQYTNSLETYAHLPNLYTQLGDLQKAGLARLHLSLYQYQESNIQGAIDTLNSCKSDTFNTDHLTMGLKLLLDPSSETIEEAYTCAENLQNPKDRIFIYQQILLHNPSDLDAYKYLIPLIKDPKEKKEMILNAIKLTHGSLINLAKSFRAQLNATILTSENWKIASTLELPPYPPELEAFLREDCTFWPGKPKSETHIIIPLFPYAEVNNQIVPLNSDILNDIDRSVGGVGLSNSNNFSDYECPADTEFRWAVMTNNIIPRSLGKSYDELIKLLPPGYKAADDVRSVAIGLLWDNQRSGKVLFFSDKAYYTYCEKRTPGSKAPIIGHNLIDDLFRIRSCGLLASSQERDENTGIAAFRKF
jgi:tetratricopeptide (TPR) repeat protein